jgi:hypothetical protein
MWREWGRNACRILVGKPEGERPSGTPRHRWEDNIVKCPGTPWWIITGSGSDDWIYWRCYYNCNQLQTRIIAHDRWPPKAYSVFFLQYERLLFLYDCWLILLQYESNPISYESSSPSSGLPLQPSANRVGITASKSFTSRICGKRALKSRCHGYASNSTNYTACVA